MMLFMNDPLVNLPFLLYPFSLSLILDLHIFVNLYILFFYFTFFFLLNTITHLCDFWMFLSLTASYASCNPPSCCFRPGCCCCHLKCQTCGQWCYGTITISVASGIKSQYIQLSKFNLLLLLKSSLNKIS